MRFAAVLLIVLACPGTFASEPGQPLDCSDWVFLEPALSCSPFGGASEGAPPGWAGGGSGTRSAIDPAGRRVFLRCDYPPNRFCGCGPGEPCFEQLRRLTVRVSSGPDETMIAYLDDRCVAPGLADVSHACQSGVAETTMTFDEKRGRMLHDLVSQCVDTTYSGRCNYTQVVWTASVSGFATEFEVLQTFTPQASLGFAVPFMPEGMAGADHFDTYSGPLTKPLDFAHAQPLQCDYPTTPPAVGDYLTVPDTVPTPPPAQGVYYLTSATYQGATRYGRKTTAGQLSGRDPSLLPACIP